MTKRKSDHVTLGNNSLRCLNCGGEFEMPLPVSINMFAAMGKAFTADHIDCKPSEKGTKRMTSADVYAWFHSWDTGLSSKTIWHFFLPGLQYKEPLGDRIPYDPADFGRCYRLLKIAPEWRARLDEMGAAIPQWKPFTDAWAQMESLYEEELPSGNCPKLYALMQRCVKQAEAAR